MRRPLVPLLLALAFAGGCSCGGPGTGQDDGGPPDAGPIIVVTDGGADPDGGTTLPDGGTCPTGHTVCAGACVDRATDEAHCGACENACAPAAACVSGACRQGAATVVLSELHGAGSRYLELFNGTDAPVQLQGYQLRFVSPASSLSVSLPAHLLAPGGFVVVDERSGAHAGHTLYAGTPFPSMTDLAVTLITNAGVPLDFVRTGSSTEPSGATGWSGPNPPGPSENVDQSLARKVYAPDTDTAEDWFLASPGSRGAFCGRPGRCGDVCVELESDRAHCGACGVACAQTQICLSGSCAAPQAGLWLTEYRRAAHPGVELQNPTAAPIDLENHRLEVIGPAATLVYFLPARTLNPGEYLWIYEGAGTPDAHALFAGPSQAFGADVAIQLFDPANVPLDFVRFGAASTAPPAGLSWFGANVAPPSGQYDESARRNVQSLDTDSAADWLAGAPTTPGFACYPELKLCQGACFAQSVDAEHCGGCGTACAAEETCVQGGCRSIGALVLSELDNNAPESFELFNGTAAVVDLSGYRVEWVADSGSGSFDFPSGVALSPGAFLVLDEGTGTSTATRLFMGTPIAWSTFIAVFLKDAGGTGVDFVRTGTSPSPPPQGTTWTGQNAPNPADTGGGTLVRNVWGADTDGAADWSLAPAATPAGFCTTGGSVCGGACVALQTSTAHCGRCGNTCATGTACANGRCTTGAVSSVLLVAADSVGYATDVKSQLDAIGAFATVDVFQANTGTPTLQKLHEYDAVLVWSNDNFASGTALGNVLADYFDAGGAVVVAVFANASIPFGGRFGQVSDGYLLLAPAGQKDSMVSLGTVHEPESPLMRNVSTLIAARAYMTTGGVANGGVVVAEWSSGDPLIVRGVVNGRNRVDLNLFPPSIEADPDFWLGDGAYLLRNALQYR